MKSNFLLLLLLVQTPVRDAYHLMCDSTVNKSQLDNNTRHNTRHTQQSRYSKEGTTTTTSLASNGTQKLLVCSFNINVSENTHTHMYVCNMPFFCQENGKRITVGLPLFLCALFFVFFTIRAQLFFFLNLVMGVSSQVIKFGRLNLLNSLLSVVCLLSFAVNCETSLDSFFFFFQNLTS